MLEAIDREFFLRQVRFQLLAVRFLAYDAFDLGGDFLARSEDKTAAF